MSQADSIDEALESMNEAQRAVMVPPGDGEGGQPWTPELVLSLSLSILVFGVLVCGLIAFLLYKDRRASELLRVFSLPLIIVSAVILVVAGYSDQQIASVMGLLGTIAGYLLGSRQATDERHPTSGVSHRVDAGGVETPPKPKSD